MACDMCINILFNFRSFNGEYRCLKSLTLDFGIVNVHAVLTTEIRLTISYVSASLDKQTKELIIIITIIIIEIVHRVDLHIKYNIADKI